MFSPTFREVLEYALFYRYTNVWSTWMCCPEDSTLQSSGQSCNNFRWKNTWTIGIWEMDYKEKLYLKRYIKTSCSYRNSLEIKRAKFSFMELGFPSKPSLWLTQQKGKFLLSKLEKSDPTLRKKHSHQLLLGRLQGSCMARISSGNCTGTTTVHVSTEKGWKPYL